MSETRINTDLLEKVKAHILEEPRRYDQETYKRPSVDAPCGTTACIAGWAVMLGQGEPNKVECGCGLPDCTVPTWFEDAKRLLGLDDYEASALFNASAYLWPEPYRSRFRSATDEAGRAKAAADFIDHIIATGKVTD